MPQIPNDTRWNSQMDCINTFIANYHKYQEIRAEQSNYDGGICKILDNAWIYREALHLQQQLKEVSAALDTVSNGLYLVKMYCSFYILLYFPMSYFC